MSELLSIAAYVMTALALLVILLDHFRGVVDLLSIRNVALVGFLVFLVISSPKSLEARTDFTYNLVDPEGTVATYLGWCAVFLIVFLITYRGGWGVTRLAHATPVPKGEPGIATMWALAVALTVAAAPIRFGIRIPLVASLANWSSAALCAVSAGLVGWIWVRRLLNPAVAIPAVGLILINVVLAQYGEFSRRPLVSIGGCVVWGMYYSALRYLPPMAMLVRLGLISLPPLLAFGLYTSVRNWSLLEGGKILDAILSDGNAAAGLADVTDQATSAVAMWVMEQNNDGTLETRHLFTIQYFFMFPVPREIFTITGLGDKPWPLSTFTAEMSGRKGVKLGDDGVTNPGGITGNAASEGGFYALIVYAIVGGLMFRYFDELLRRNPMNPLLVLPIGSALGHTLGIPRGESSTFTFIFVYSAGTAILAMLLISKLLSRAVPSLADADAELAEDGWDTLPDGGGSWGEEPGYDVVYGEDVVETEGRQR